VKHFATNLLVGAASVIILAAGLKRGAGTPPFGFHDSGLVEGGVLNRAIFFVIDEGIDCAVVWNNLAALN